ncbi:hypothetical protein HMPREF3221_00632 [Fusobacterium nucleatum]|uniref:Uncharacterized protein n=2 Tax=Fusobacteriaceae TaxID=203492 RepID=A0A133P610_FUSNU|nr:hypothetical protein HMPREF3221_00632 [Fusobacterium nucleatum]
MKGQVMNNQDLYFKNEETKYIFYLVALEGKIQLDFLNIDRGHYENRQRARNWYEEIKKKIKYSKHPKLEEAIENLDKLYRGMGGRISY